MLSWPKEEKTIFETMNNGYKAVIMYEHKLTVKNKVLSMNLAKNKQIFPQNPKFNLECL